ncbi:hypothetical protein FNV43_RR15668 [Rhamnella rubrinervis]|uniref:DYW domain-containing protein n=1 Tax=Rhamnella rubrinervis TaxID=2594499 RepID=A0A8K0E881_9ROSA|nr:hypothetical protein FNV43_RR15668 [Rhamnella rubrinervis]
MASVVQPPITALPSSALSHNLHSYFFHYPSKPTAPPSSPSKPLALPSPSLSLSTVKPTTHHYHNHVFFSVSASQSLQPQKVQHFITSGTFADCSSSRNRAGFDIDGLFDLLRLSGRCGDVELAKAVHSSILKFPEDTYMGNALITAYLKLGLVEEACKVFRSLSCPNVVSFTALISGFSKSNREAEAIELFFRMRSSGIEPNEYSYVAILTACIRILELELGSQVHAVAIKMGYLDCVFVSNALMGLYGKCRCLDFVLKLFSELPHRDLVSWNTVIFSAVNEFMYGKAFELFREMRRNDGFGVDHLTVSTLLTACTDSTAFVEGQGVHAHAIKYGLESDLSVNNALIGFYTKCGNLKDVSALFERMPVRDTITWTEIVTAYMNFGMMDLALDAFEKMPERNSISYNALLAGFCKNEEGLKALNLFIEMVEERLELTDFTLTSVVNACGLIRDCKISKQIHGFTVKFGFGSNACIEAALLDMCTRCDRMADAKKMFHRWPVEQDSSVVMTSMICGYSRNGQLDEAISLFNLGQYEGKMVVDEVASTSLLGLCGSLGFHELGKQMHCLAIKSDFLTDIGVGNAIVSMYAKCWSMEQANKAFETMAAHDVVSWNGLIAGHLLHRQGDEALAVWSEMNKTSITPDKITFTLIISAYRFTNANLVDNCRSLLFSMKTKYDIEPTSEHFASFVGVLGYRGLLEEAEEVVNKLPFEPEVSVWRALLDSCRIRLNTTMGKRVAKRILAMEPNDPSTYILVSNLYSASGRWHCSDMVREDMREKGFRKHPGQSWIVHENKIWSFYARDKSHPQAKDIYSGLEILIRECLKAGYVPDTNFVLHEIEEHQKKEFLFYHSAKLAATYGLLMTKPSKPVRVVKNIVLCGDCHTFLKYVSIVTRRVIFVRDASGFHCFSGGQCSCKDYW